MTLTLAEALSDDAIEFDELERRYQPVLTMVEVLIGVVPNCDRYLEIWEPGFRTYNLLVPNLLNLPASLLGRSAPKDVVGLGMYASSRAASCAYCSAHTCSFALRRGSSPDAVTGESRTPGEAATVAVAEALSTMPHQYRSELGDELRQHYSDNDAEWIVMGVAMMGFLNKFMDAIGVELEPEAISDVAELIEPTGWAVGQHGWDMNPDSETSSDENPLSVDSASTMLQVFRNAPGAVRLDKKWLKGVPKDQAQARQWVSENYGFDEPILTTMRHGKPSRALAGALRHNLDPEQSELGVGVKAVAGLVFANHAGNDTLAAQSIRLAKHHGIDGSTIAAANESTSAAKLDPATAAAITLARAIAPSPATVDEATVSAVSSNLSSAQIVELAVWISVCQLLHRLAVYYHLDGEPSDAERETSASRAASSEASTN